jgi:hypothetical protein
MDALRRNKGYTRRATGISITTVTATLWKCGRSTNAVNSNYQPSTKYVLEYSLRYATSILTLTTMQASTIITIGLNISTAEAITMNLKNVWKHLTEGNVQARVIKDIAPFKAGDDVDMQLIDNGMVAVSDIEERYDTGELRYEEYNLDTHEEYDEYFRVY